MLVLGRYESEKIRIGDDIVVMVVKVHDTGKVRLGIEAPANVQVHREEIYQEILRDGYRRKDDSDGR